MNMHLGRKVILFLLILTINTVAFYLGKFTTEFGYFCIALYGAIVTANVTQKIGMKNKDK